MKGFSHRNLKYMVHFAKEYPHLAIGQQVVAQIPWGHNILLLQKPELFKTDSGALIRHYSKIKSLALLSLSQMVLLTVSIAIMSGLVKAYDPLAQ